MKFITAFTFVCSLFAWEGWSVFGQEAHTGESRSSPKNDEEKEGQTKEPSAIVPAPAPATRFFLMTSIPESISHGSFHATDEGFELLNDSEKKEHMIKVLDRAFNSFNIPALLSFGRPISKDSPIILGFNQPVDPIQLTKFVTITPTESKPTPEGFNIPRPRPDLQFQDLKIERVETTQPGWFYAIKPAQGWMSGSQMLFSVDSHLTPKNDSSRLTDAAAATPRSFLSLVRVSE